MGNVKITYKFDEKHMIISPTDTYGNVNPRGKLVMHMFTDAPSLPNSQTFELNKDGYIKKEGKHDLVYSEAEKGEEDTTYMDRIIQTTIILDAKSAIEIAFWMLDILIKEKSVEIDVDKLKDNFMKMIGKNGD